MLGPDGTVVARAYSEHFLAEIQEVTTGTSIPLDDSFDVPSEGVYTLHVLVDDEPLPDHTITVRQQGTP